MALKNIIFDLGNVIIDIDSTRTVRGLSDLGIKQASDIFTVEVQNELCDQFECGDISPATFIKALGDYSTHDDVDLNAVQKAWESMILQSHPDRLQLLQELRKKYNVFLLSNTNQIHYTYINTMFFSTYNVKCLDDLFDKAYYSFQVGLRKPMSEIFTHVLKDKSLNPSETLFIDDLEKNINIAQQLGIQTLHAKEIDSTWQHVSNFLLG